MPLTLLNALSSGMGGSHPLRVIRAPAEGRCHSEREGVLADVLARRPEQNTAANVPPVALQIFPALYPPFLAPQTLLPSYALERSWLEQERTKGAVYHAIDFVFQTRCHFS